MPQHQPFSGEHAQDPSTAQMTHILPVFSQDWYEGQEITHHESVTATGRHQQVRSTGLEGSQPIMLTPAAEQAALPVVYAEPEDTLPDQQDKNR